MSYSDASSISDYAFYKNARIESVDLPARLARIGRLAFKGCTSLRAIILPYALIEVGFDAFYGCSALKRIAIPKSVKRIEDMEAFGACDSLVEISFGGSVEEWEYLTGGKSITVERSDLSLYTPRVIFPAAIAGTKGGKNED